MRKVVSENFLLSIKTMTDGFELSDETTKKYPKKFVPIPVGASSEKSQIPTVVKEEIWDRLSKEKMTEPPRVKYEQNEEDICVYASCASALHYCGLTGEAQAVMACMNDSDLSYGTNAPIKVETNPFDRIKRLFQQREDLRHIQVRTLKPSKFHLLKEV